MHPAYLLQLYEYNQWANQRVWECVIQLEEDKFTQDLDYSVGSIYIQMVHTMAVEHWWLHFLRTSTLDFLELEQFPDRATIRAKWDDVEAINRTYVATITPEELERLVKPAFWEENTKPIKVWQALMQVMNHSTDHRAQTLAMLHRLGAPTVGQDFLAYLHA